jgi:hypothetical protein
MDPQSAMTYASDLASIACANKQCKNRSDLLKSDFAITEYLGISIAMRYAISGRAGISITGNYGTAIAGDWGGLAISGKDGRSIVPYLGFAMTGPGGYILIENGQSAPKDRIHVLGRAGIEIEPYTLYRLRHPNTEFYKCTFSDVAKQVDCYDLEYLTGRRLKQIVKNPRIELIISGKEYTIW